MDIKMYSLLQDSEKERKLERERERE